MLDRAALSIVALCAIPVSAVASGSFHLTSIAPTPGSIWKLNRPMVFTFDQAVDLGSVNANTISIVAEGGAPASGTFTLFNPTTVVFEPHCPLEPDYSDAGLAVGTAYTIVVPDNTSGGPTVMSVGGLSLDTGGISNCATPDSDDPAVLFDDTGAGPPVAVVRPQGSADLDATYLELGGDPAQRVYFERDGLGNSVLPAGFLAPLNLYADLASHVAVMVELNQGVSPLAANFAPERVRLEYFEPGRGWRSMASDVRLVRNCEGAGATVRVEPRGVLPQGRSVRVHVAGTFTDLVGDGSGAPQLDFAVFPVSSATDTGGNPLELADDVLESFLLAGDDEGSLEDDSTLLSAPRAQWGEGVLQASTGFGGSGGPNGDFDWYVPANTTIALDTTFAQIVGGPGGVPTAVQQVIDGVVDVRDLFVPASSSVIVQGPNPLVVWASGEVRIDGTISVNGSNADPVFTLNSPQIPEPGAAGQGGGGTGGTGSWRTTTSTERGGPGFGAFDVPALGGEGGESGWSPNNSNFGVNRRAAGGGGGVLGADVFLANGCVDQSILGLDAESGFPGATAANAATRPGELMPWGGHIAPGPFTDGDPSNDFFGVMRYRFGTPEERLIQGELASPWAGSGGGGGGDATLATVYPPPTFIFNNEDKGAGGGGGAGCIQIRALGAITFGPAGRIEARGGHGSGGENTNFVNRIGGGSGGGSGGHVIVESLTGVDFSLVPSTSVAILARGGQGGAGADNAGGADDQETLPISDAKHVGVRGPGDMSDNPWIPPVPQACQIGLGVRRAAGGDGGPGIVQLHVPATSDISTAQGSLAELASLVLPAPVGFSPPDAIERTLQDQLLPTFGTQSIGLSQWIALGEASVAPGTSAPDPIAFVFGGTDPDDPNAPGSIVANAGHVPDLAPIASSATPILPFPPNPPYLSPDRYTLFVAASDLAPGDEVYVRNPGLLRDYLLKLTSTSNPSIFVDYDVEFASYDELAGTLALTVSTSGPQLLSNHLYSLHPRYFRVVTSGLENFLPVDTRVQIEFQAAPADKLGRPDVAHLFPGPNPQLDWTADVEDLNAALGNAQLRYYRFRVTFDLAPDGGPLDPSVTPPGLGFLRLPFRF